MTATMLRRLARAAALRARAVSWPKVAAQVGSRPVTCSRWPDRYPVEWKRLYDEARRMVYEVAQAEALLTLQGLLRDDDERIRERAAKLLKRYGPRLLE